ncbi:uncharacterized protein SPSK_10657 [Sporothrix schenckii 1099-18]|uniref:Uncharacterized protein n=1 Tax=Sporothrix schenckii 1099-18 TaxID=1397361 RepID=A0A0F2LX82_SPOSC|nr:uncharacterized protein SPSK_10657 [Sporothrix schenckii 1099-18]KJR80501.1 hypothetical protein SPSK_10657 [Sporothrix schenckii 1099-18]
MGGLGNGLRQAPATSLSPERIQIHGIHTLRIFFLFGALLASGRIGYIWQDRLELEEEKEDGGKKSKQKGNKARHVSNRNHLQDARSARFCMSMFRTAASAAAEETLDEKRKTAKGSATTLVVFSFSALLI